MLNRLVRFKVYWNRSAFYESIVKALLVIAFVNKMWENDPLGLWLHDNRFWATPIIVLVYIFYRLTVGYLDKRFVRRKESDEVTETNPRFMEMYHNIDEIYKKTLIDEERKENSTNSQPTRQGARFREDGC